MDLYEVIHIPSNMKYVGITYRNGKTYLDRFNEHLTHKGSLKISSMLYNGSLVSDFKVNLIYTTSLLSELFVLENAYITENKSLGISLNQNGGGGFIGKPYFLNSVYKEYGYDVNIYLEKHTNTKIQDFISTVLNMPQSLPLTMNSRKILKRTLSYSFYINELYTIYNENISYIDFYNKLNYNSKKIYSIFNKYGLDICKLCIAAYLESPSFQTIITVIRNIKQERNNLAKNRNELFFNYYFLSKHANLIDEYRLFYGGMINSPADTEGWKDGRIRYINRIKDKSFTTKEVKKFANNSKNVQLFWDKQTSEYRHNRTSRGLAVMNNKIFICPHCNRSGLTKGNYIRHHNNNCKYKGMTITHVET